MLASAAACLICAISAQGAVFHVSADAPKGGDGSKDRPFGSLDDAVAAARKAPGPDEIVVADGRYFLEDKISLGTEDSGLVIRAANPGKAVITGGVRIGGWTKEPDSPFWQADVPEARDGKWFFRALFVGGRPAKRAVYPADGKRLQNTRKWTVRWMSSVGNGWERKPTAEDLGTMPYKKGDLPPGFDCASADVRSYHSWDDSLVRVLSNDVENCILHFRTPTRHPAGSFGNHGYVIYNIPDGMTEPGQWWLDAAAGRIHYWPLPGEDMARVEVTAPKTGMLLSMRGGRKGPVKDVSLDGLVFECTVPPEKAASFAGTGLPGTIDCAGLAGCRFERLVVRCTGAVGALLARLTKCRVAGCDFLDTGSCALVANGSEVEIVSNRIFRTGRVFTSACGASLGGSDIHFAANEIADIPYCGVCFGGNRHVYEGNVVRRVMTIMHDGAAFYGGGSSGNCAMRGNTVFDIVPNGPGSGCSAFYFDEGAYNGVVESNRTDGVAHPIHNHMARSLVVRDNLFCATNDVRLTFSRCNGCSFVRNEIRTNGKVVAPSPEATPEWSGNVVKPYSGFEDGAAGGGEELPRPPVKRLKPRKDSLPAPATETPPALDGTFDAAAWPGVWGSINRGADLTPFNGPPIWVRAAHDATNLYLAVRTVLFRHESLAVGHDDETSDSVAFDFPGLRLKGYADNTSNAKFFYGGHEKEKKRGFGKMVLYVFAVPFADLGLESAPAAGKTLPFNCTVRNGVYRETRYWDSPSATNSVPGKILFK